MRETGAPLLKIAPSGSLLNEDPTCGKEVLTIDFSLLDHQDEDACYIRLVELLHPDGSSLPSLRKAAALWTIAASHVKQSHKVEISNGTMHNILMLYC